jgi:hypothetical protein
MKRPPAMRALEQWHELCAQAEGSRVLAQEVCAEAA